MFTGIIEETGVVRAFDRHGAGASVTIEAGEVLADLAIGGSIAVNGCCLTAVERGADFFRADLSPETLARTNLRDLQPRSKVNLERPLLPSSRLSGHFVQGHVDGVGEFVSIESVGDGNWWLRIRAPRELLRYLVFKGSIAIDGVSLTIASLEDDVFGIAVIPHTYAGTTLGALRPGSRVNLECDMIAKHVERLLQQTDVAAQRPRLTPKRLREEGF